MVFADAARPHLVSASIAGPSFELVDLQLVSYGLRFNISVYTGHMAHERRVGIALTKLAWMARLQHAIKIRSEIRQK